MALKERAVSEPNGLSNGNPTVKKFSEIIDPAQQFMGTSPKSIGQLCPELTCLQEDSPAKTSQMLESEKASPENAVGSGRNTLKPLAFYDPKSCSLRTWQRSLDGELIRFSATLPRSGMMWNGIVYQLPTLTPLTDVTEFSLLPTPVVMDSVNPSNQHKEKYYYKKTKNGTMRRYWIHEKKNSSLTLSKMAAFAMWPTPTARQWKGASQKRDDLNSTVKALEGSSGKLNPAWVEWLMGFPKDWTSISGENASKVWATRSSHNAPNSLQKE